MNPSDIQNAGDALYDALVQRTTMAPLTTQYADITIDDAYQSQLRMIQRRLDAGEVDIALERVHQARPQSFGNHQIECFDTEVFEVGASGVEVAVVGNQVAFLAGRGK